MMKNGARDFLRDIKKKIIMLLMLVLLISSFPHTDAKADLNDTKAEMEEAERQRDEAQQQLQAAQDRLAETENSLAGLESTRNTYQGQMNSLNAEMQLVADNLAVIQAQMDLKQIEINETQVSLNAAIDLCEQQYESMKLRIRFMYEQGDATYLELIMSASDFGQMLNYADYIEALSAYDRKQLDEYIETQKTISANMVALEEEYAQMKELEAQQLEQQESISELISGVAVNIANTADSINAVQAQADAYEAECDARAAEAAAAAAEYEAIKAQYEEELRLSRLAAQSSWRSLGSIVFTGDDRYLLANLIYCEAGGEPYEGQVAVGSVVMNRVLSSVFPNTIPEVIYQRRQFAPVSDGHLALALAQDRATASCYQAADAVMGGTNNIGSCVFFRTPIPGLTGTQIGGHIFY